jgi:hypothetical protein
MEIVRLNEENSYHLFITGRINGKMFDFMIDTGASQTIFDIAVIPELPKEEQPEIHSTGINKGELVTSFGIIRKFELGKLKKEEWKVILVDMAHINGIYKRFSSKQVAGLIGSDFLLAHQSVINYKKRHLVLRTA